MTLVISKFCMAMCNIGICSSWLQHNPFNGKGQHTDSTCMMFKSVSSHAWPDTISIKKSTRRKTCTTGKVTCTVTVKTPHSDDMMLSAPCQCHTYTVAQAVQHTLNASSSAQLAAQQEHNETLTTFCSANKEPTSGYNTRSLSMV